MDGLFAFLFLISLIFLIIGLVSPKASLFWNKNVRTRKKSSMIYGGLTLLFLILFAATSDTKKTANSKDSTTAEAQPVASTETPKEPELTQSQRDSISNAEQERQLEEVKKNTISA